MPLPETGISAYLVAETLGHPITYDVRELCIHPNINMWSKRKPVRDGRVDMPFEEVGMSDNCGLALVPYSGDDTKITYYNRPGTWVDQTGQHITPYRLHDFRGYEHEIMDRPVLIGPKPSSIERKQTIAVVSSVVHPFMPVVTLPDLPNDLRLGVVIYGKTYTTDAGVLVGCASAMSQTDPYVVVNFTDSNWLYLDVKFCLMSGYHPWSASIPSTLMYEISRQYPGENANWTNVQLVTPAEDVKTFEIAGFVSQQQVQYVIESYTTTTGRIDIVDMNGLAMQITGISLPSNTRVSGTANNMPLQAGRAYTAYLYLGSNSNPVASRQMIVN